VQPGPRVRKSALFSPNYDLAPSRSIAVLAVLFLRQAVERAGDLDLLSLAAALELMIAALVFFLSMGIRSRE
jgi:hypothetical protein